MAFKLDENGKVVTQPVTGSELSLAAGIGVLLSVEYVQDLRELEAGATPQRVQLLLTPHTALARIIHEGGKSEGQLCYKHVV